MKQITVYSKKHCQACEATKRLLLAEGYGFIEVNVELPENEHHAARLVDEGWRSLPVVDVAGHSKWSGHKPELILALKS